jgi:formylmethanofuran dehydrogenase subunit E
MTALQVLEELNSKNISLTVDGGSLRYKAPKSTMTDETISLLKEYKAQIVDALRAKELLRPCYCCGSQMFWRKKDNTGGRWICKVCHPPVLSKDEIEWLQ